MLDTSPLVAGVDPLLLLVSELKKQEDAERLARTEADAERLAAEKEAEQEERALDDAFDDDRSYEVGDEYQEVDLEALEAERTALESTDIEELEFGGETDDLGTLELTEQAVSDGDGLDLSDEDILSLDIEEDDIALEEDAEALEAAGVLDAEEEAEDGVEEIASDEDTTIDADMEVGAQVAEAEAVEDDAAVAAVEQSESGPEYAERMDEEAASSDALTNGDVALRKRGNVSSNDTEMLDTFPLSGREAVLGIDIEEIDFEFEDE